MKWNVSSITHGKTIVAAIVTRPWLCWLTAIAKTNSGLAQRESESLELSGEERRLIEVIEKLVELNNQFNQYQENIHLVSAFETQILSLSTIFKGFLLVQSNALQEVLDKISEDVADYYRALHPKENVDKVRLKVVGDEGIEFEYEFHGKQTHPPMKYLSESHLNSLGICLFLASAKLFNSSVRFMVLDDVVTSFDLGHRRRLLRLIKDHFGDWQIILLTHERLWFDLTKKELAESGWLFKEVEWDADNGIVPFNRHLLRAMNDHSCKQLVGLIMDYLIARWDTDEEWEELFRADNDFGDRLPPEIESAVILLRYDKIGRWESRAWDWHEKPDYDSGTLKIAKGENDRRKQDALYVRIGGDGRVCPRPKIAPEEIEKEKERLDDFLILIKSLLDSGAVDRYYRYDKAIAVIREMFGKAI